MRTAARSVVISTLLYMSFPLTALAEPEPVVGPLDAARAAELALRSNADLAAANAAIDMARARFDQAGRWPNPELGFAGRSDFAFRNEGERSWGIDSSSGAPRPSWKRTVHGPSRVRSIAVVVAGSHCPEPCDDWRNTTNVELQGASVSFTPVTAPDAANSALRLVAVTASQSSGVRPCTRKSTFPENSRGDWLVTK